MGSSSSPSIDNAASDVPTNDDPFNASPYPPGSTIKHPDVQTYSTRDASNRLLSWKSRPVEYIDDEPYYRRADNGNLEKIWFPNGPPPYDPDTERLEDEYDEETKEAYRYTAEHHAFRDGAIPLNPPRREWCSYDM